MSSFIEGSDTPSLLLTLVNSMLRFVGAFVTTGISGFYGVGFWLFTFVDLSLFVTP